jgi:hypothetical protein
MNYELTSEREAIETTRGGLYGGPRDEFRTFVPGPWEHTLTIKGGVVDQKWRITDEQAAAIEAGGEEAVAAFLASLT